MTAKHRRAESDERSVRERLEGATDKPHSERERKRDRWGGVVWWCGGVVVWCGGVVVWCCVCE
jgi:hypothetical protein